MFRNYIKIAVRNLVKQKGFSIINIFGLAVGISACLLIAAFIQSEISYDKHHKNSDLIYRITTEFDFPNQNDKVARNSFPFGPQFKEDYPDISGYLRIFLSGKQTVRFDDKMFNESNICFSDSSLFDFFDYEMIAGNNRTALTSPGSVVISEERADAYFGSPSNALDKLLEFQNKSYRVTGVFRQNENETHLPYNFFISISSLPKPLVEQATFDYMWMLTFTYIKVNPGVSKEMLEKRLASFYEKRVAPWVKENNIQGKLAYRAQPLQEIHLSTELSFDYPTNSNPVYITIFLLAGIFILIIACFNYLNLITARSIKRSKEVGIRKVMGADRKQLILQFLGESAIVTMAAFVIAYALTSLLLPSFNQLTGKSFTEAAFFSSRLVLPLIMMFVFISVVAGSYPAFFLSRFQPSQVLKIGAFVPPGNGRKAILTYLVSPSNIRKILVVLQFSISIILITGTIVIYRQFSYLKNKDLGFNKEQVFVIDIPGDTTIAKNLQTIKNELLRNPNIKQVAGSSHIPGTQTGTLYFNVEQMGKMEDKFLNYVFIDEDYLDLMKIPVTEGRNFSKGFPSDVKESFIINEAAAKYLNWDNPIDKKMANGLGVNGKVIGVTRNFNYSSLHNPLSPLVMMYAPATQGYLLIKVQPFNLRESLRFIQSKWQQFDAKHPMDAFFLDDNFDKVYQKEKNMITIFGYFAFLAIVISCMGLFGLAAFIAEQKTKEIGIRKVLGATVPGIAVYLSKDFLKLVLLSNVIAIPIAFYGINKWLQNFAFRVDISAWMFILAAVSAFIIALLTVGYQSLKAALLNPVKSLRYE